MKNPLIVILGPTAIGKTSLAIRIAANLGGEVISADSRQVFKGMDIGTGKDLASYQINGNAIPVHLVDLKFPGEPYHVHAFQEDFFSAFLDMQQRNVLPILCGGTGMYINSILQKHELTAIPKNEELRTQLANWSKNELINYFRNFNSAHPADESSKKRLIRAIEIAAFLEKNTFTPKVRPEIDPLVIGLQIERTQLKERISARLQSRMADGMIEEVERLLIMGVQDTVLYGYGMEYKYITAYLNGHISHPELMEQLFTAICQFAKRQMTFFRKMEKDGIYIHWLNTNSDSDVIFQKAKKLILEHLKAVI